MASRELVRRHIWRALYGPAGYFTTVDAIYSAPAPLDFERLIAQWDYRATLAKMYKVPRTQWAARAADACGR